MPLLRAATIATSRALQGVDLYLGHDLCSSSTVTIQKGFRYSKLLTNRLVIAVVQLPSDRRHRRTLNGRACSFIFGAVACLSHLGYLLEQLDR